MSISHNFHAQSSKRILNVRLFGNNIYPIPKEKVFKSQTTYIFRQFIIFQIVNNIFIFVICSIYLSAIFTVIKWFLFMAKRKVHNLFRMERNCMKSNISIVQEMVIEESTFYIIWKGRCRSPIENFLTYWEPYCLEPIGKDCFCFSFKINIYPFYTTCFLPQRCFPHLFRGTI